MENVKNRIAANKQLISECRETGDKSAVLITACKDLATNSSQYEQIRHWPLLPPGTFRVSGSKDIVGIPPVHKPYKGLMFFRLLVRLGGFLVSSPESDCFSCISGLRLVSVCNVWTVSKGSRGSRYVEKPICGWACVDVFFSGSYLSDLLCEDAGVRFIDSLSDTKYPCYFVYVLDWRSFVSRFGVPVCCVGSVVILVSFPLDYRGLSVAFRTNSSQSFTFGEFDSGTSKCPFWHSHCMFSYNNAFCGGIPVFVSLSLSSRVMHRRFGCNVSSLIIPDRAGCLHDLVMANIRPFLGVFWFFKDFSGLCEFIYTSFNLTSISDVVNLLTCFVSCHARCSRYLDSDLKFWPRRHVLSICSLMEQFLDTGSRLFDSFLRGTPMCVYSELLYFFCVMTPVEWDYLLQLASRGFELPDEMRRKRQHGRLVGYYCRPIIYSDICVLYEI